MCAMMIQILASHVTAQHISVVVRGRFCESLVIVFVCEDLSVCVIVADIYPSIFRLSTLILKDFCCTTIC